MSRKNPEIVLIVKKPSEAPEIGRTTRDAFNEYAHEMVDGYFEMIGTQFSGNILMVLNEEGKLRKLEPNVYDRKRNVMIVGTILLVKAADEEVVTLTPEDILEISLAFMEVGREDYSEEIAEILAKEMALDIVKGFVEKMRNKE